MVVTVRYKCPSPTHGGPLITGVVDRLVPGQGWAWQHRWPLMRHSREITWPKPITLLASSVANRVENEFTLSAREDCGRTFSLSGKRSRVRSDTTVRLIVANG